MRMCKIERIIWDLRACDIHWLAIRRWRRQGIAFWGVTCGNIFSGASYLEKRAYIEECLKGVRAQNPAQTMIYKGNSIYIDGLRPHRRNIELVKFWSDIE